MTTIKPVCVKCFHFNYKITDETQGYRCKCPGSCPALDWQEADQIKFIDELDTFSTIIEALCVAASPDFQSSRNPNDFVAALENTIEDNKDFFEYTSIDKLSLFDDQIDEENGVVSNINQLLGNKHEIRNIDDDKLRTD